MLLRTYTLEQSTEWDAIVRSFGNYDVYYLSGYTRAYKIRGDGEPMLFYYTEADDGAATDGATLRGVNVVMKRDIGGDPRFAGIIENNKWFDFATPYGYGGWLIEGRGDAGRLFEAYRSWCGQHNIVSEFVRYHPVLENHIIPEASKAYDVKALGCTIAMDLSSPEVIWENLTSKNRNMIRKAQKSGVVIHDGRSPEIFEKFKSIYDITMILANADSYYYFEQEFYNSIIGDLPREARVFYAEYENKVVAASIMLESNGRLNYHLSGLLREYASVAPTNLLLYQAALWGCGNGCKTLHLGGGVGNREDSLYRFKSGFYRGEPRRFYIGSAVYDEGMYERLAGMTNDIGAGGFFPKYRA